MHVALVRSLEGTECSCEDWLDHWEKFGGQSVAFCPVMGCHEIDLAGVHVRKLEGDDATVYILPLCRHHSVGSGSALAVDDRWMLVNADVRKTYGRGK